MRPDSRLANALKAGGFIVTAEFLPPVTADASVVKAGAELLGNNLAAVSVGDNHGRIGMSSVGVCSVFLQLGLEPIWQVVTRDRNRIALQSDLLGASALGIRACLCTSGRHQKLMDCPDSANVYDLDSVQLIGLVRQMRDKGTLLDGTAVAGGFSMLIGAVANPYLRPMELNMIQLAKKIEAGTDFIQTQPTFDVDEFAAWLDAARSEHLVDKAAILAGILPLSSAEESQHLQETHTDLRIPAPVVDRLKAASGPDAQEAEGVKLCAEIIGRLRGMEGIRGIHILSGGNEKIVPKLRAAAGL